MTQSGMPGDLSIGAFTSTAPWTVVPEAMKWRAGIDDLREARRRLVPALTDRRRMPGTRLFAVGAVLMRAAGPWAVRKRLGRPEADSADLARRIRLSFERLGTTYIKLGQVIASGDGMLPEAIVAEFKRCRDQVPSESFESVRQVVEGDLGSTIETLFSEFDPTPIASASIAQVHAARLRSGEEVVVKVQRPRIADTVARDLRTMSWLAPILVRRVPQLILANLPAYIELFAETIIEELDFRLEAQNMLDIASVLARSDQRAVVVPRPHPELVTRRVLVMERLEGFKIDDDAGMREAGIEPSTVFSSLMVSFFEGAGIYGVFHGDLHGGNMMVTREGTAAVFDFGITGRFDTEARVALMQLLLGGLAEDVTGQIRAFRDLGGFPPDADVDAIARDLNVEELRATQAQMSPEQMAIQMRELVTQLLGLGASLPKSLFLFIKGMMYLNGAIAALAADVNILETLANVFSYFETNHREAFTTEFGVDLAGIDFAATMQAQMSQQLGVDVSEGITFREMSALQTERLAAARTATR